MSGDKRDDGPFRPYGPGESPLDSMSARPKTMLFNRTSISTRHQIPKDATGLPVVIFEDMIDEETIRTAVCKHYGHDEEVVP